MVTCKWLSVAEHIIRKFIFWVSLTFISYMNERTCAYDRVRPEMGLAIEIDVILKP
jgi:hypothetical protein